MSQKKKRNIIIGTLCGVLLLMVVGYAAFNSVLKINGTSNISSNWDIKITKITSNVLHGTPTNAIEPTGVGTLTATFETNLVSPGDSMQYIITITNNGSMNATLEKITVSKPNNDAITFETSGLTEGSTLTPKGTADLTVTVTYKDIAEGQKQPENTKGTLSVTLDYVQEGTSGGTTGGETAADKLIATAVTTGDGLYEDEYESGRYVYKGANPNNYITFNNETWRIISVETDNTLKIMKIDSIVNKEWDTSGSNNWARPSTLNTYLNNETEGVESYYNTLNSEAKSLIQTHLWKIGGVKSGNTNLSTQITSENRATWTGNIGLISVSDFLKANTNTTQCGNFNLNNTNYSTCKTTNYIVPSSMNLWTISPDADNPNLVFTITSGAGVSNGSARFSASGVRPTLYLIPNITLLGKGTSDDPYTIIS